MKEVLLAFVSIVSLIAFVIIGVTFVETNDKSLIVWIFVTMFVSLVSAVYCRVSYERGKR